MFAALPELEDRLPWSGAWIYPVGAPQAFQAPDPEGAPGYTLLRGLRRSESRASRHQGADWGNRRSGGTVRAAAHGVVVRTSPGASGAYGDHVVLAHRLPGGGWAYSVYAHLLTRSIAVAPGDVVAAGTPLGRVGRTGNASTDHLHFEIRHADDPTVRWERTTAVDPVAFIAERLPASAESTWARPYLEWAELSALVAGRIGSERPLDRATWWSMLARAARHSIRDLPSDVALVRDLLTELGIVASARREDPNRAVEWSELERDLDRLSTVGTRLPGAPPGPANDRGARPRRPTLADACAAMARIVERREALADH